LQPLPPYYSENNTITCKVTNFLIDQRGIREILPFRRDGSFSLNFAFRSEL
jgi:hypothetical protein